MSVSISTWNVNQGLSSGELAPALRERILELDTDIILINEATIGQQVCIEPSGFYGYDGVYFQRCDGYERDDSRALIQGLYLNRIAGRTELLRHASTNLIQHEIEVEGVVVNVLGGHFDDRTEKSRIDGVSHYSEFGLGSEVALLFGDINALDPASIRAKIFGSKLVKQIALYAPNARVRSVIERVGEMSNGSVISMLQQMGYVDSDTTDLLTFNYKNLLKLALDKFLFLPERIRVEQPVLCLETKGLSDHIAVKTKLHAP